MTDLKKNDKKGQLPDLEFDKITVKYLLKDLELQINNIWKTIFRILKSFYKK